MTLLYKLGKPYRNLTIPQRILQIARFLTSLLALSFALVTLVGPLLNNNDFYFSKINCVRKELSKGLYNSLRTSVGQNNDQHIPLDATLTNSQVLTLTAYAENLYLDAPQYTFNSIWRWCEGFYMPGSGDEDYDSDSDYSDSKEHLKRNRTLTCFDYEQSQNSSIFDYRGQLYDIGLESVLAYAYDNSDSGYQENSDFYYENVQKRDNMFKGVKPSLYLCVFFQIIIIILAYVLYSNRSSNHVQKVDLQDVPRFLLHILTTLTCVSFLTSIVSASIMTRVMLEVQREVKDGLQTFGVNMDFGHLWFSCLWITTVFSGLVMFSWVFPVWCANPVEDDYFDEEDEEDSYGRPGAVRIGSGGSRAPTAKYLRKSTAYYHHPKEVTEKKKKNGKGFGKRFSAFVGPSSVKIDDKSTTDVNDHRERLIDSGKNYSNSSFSDEDSGSQESTISYEGYPFRDNQNSASAVFDDSSEEALRKLGKSLSRKSSVRHLNRKLSSKSKVRLETQAEDPFEPEYNGVARSGSQQSHYREETFDGYGHVQEESVTSYSERESDVFRDNVTSIQQRDLLNAFRRNNTKEARPSSILNEDEMELLDFNENINRIKR